MAKKAFAILPLGGSGQRFGSDKPKQLIPFNGKPLFRYAFDALANSSLISTIVLPCLEGTVDEVARSINGFDKGKDILFVKGGATRFESVRNAVMALPDEGFVLISDGDRPFLNEELIADCLSKAEQTGGAVAAISSSDSLLQIGEAPHYVDRGSIMRVQTPQCFDLAKLKEAYAKSDGRNYSDEGSLFMAAGYSLAISKGDIRNIKVDTPAHAALFFALGEKDE